jgi:hypothetical protein
MPVVSTASATNPDAASQARRWPERRVRELRMFELRRFELRLLELRVSERRLRWRPSTSSGRTSIRRGGTGCALRLRWGVRWM